MKSMTGSPAADGGRAVDARLLDLDDLAARAAGSRELAVEDARCPRSVALVR